MAEIKSLTDGLIPRKVGVDHSLIKRIQQCSDRVFFLYMREMPSALYLKGIGLIKIIPYPELPSRCAAVLILREDMP
jgi:hypothetical protein